MTLCFFFFQFLKQTMVCLQGTQQLVAETINFLETSYTAHPHCSAIDLARQLLLQYLADPGVKPALGRLLSSMARRTLDRVTTAANPSECSELIASAFQGFSQSVKKHTDIFSGQAGVQDLVDASALLRCACFSLQLPEDGAAKYSAAFIVHLVSAGGQRQDLAAVVTHSGPEIVRAAVASAVKGASSNSDEYAADVLACLGKHRLSHLGPWLQNGLVDIADFPSPAIPTDVKTEFARTLLREKSNKRKVNEAVKEFVAECRVRTGKPNVQ
jgi:hypothetical protein